MEHILISMISGNNNLYLNRNLIHKLGILEAVILTELIEECNSDITEDGYIPFTVKSLEEKTTIKKDTQKRIITKLEKLGIISTVKRGLPVKRCAKINENVLKKFL